MRKIIIALLVLIFSFVAFASEARATIYWGAWMDGSTYDPTWGDAPWDSRTWDTFESHTGKKVSIVHFGMPWKWNGTMQSFSANPFNFTRNRGAIPFVDWGAMEGNAIDPNFQSADIIAGTYDSYIMGWALGAKNWGKPFFLRFNWEMNGWWQFPWSEGLELDGTVHNGNAAGDYAKAWRHVHDIFTAAGATNVNWVWCPNIFANDTVGGKPRYAPLSQIYPGDAYVDWTCLDGYNKYSTWLSFTQLFSGGTGSWFRNSYSEVNAISGSKPMIIGEFASLEAGGNKAAWIRSALENELPANFPNIKAILWFNWNDNNPALTWPIESSAASQDGFKTAIGNSYYAENCFGIVSTSKITPIPGGVYPGSGDAIGDGKINAADLKGVLSAFLKPTFGCVDQYSDTKVNALDFVLVSKRLP